MTYKEYTEKRQKEYNELPIFWAFSMDQFKEAMEERGLTVDDTDKVYCFGHGGYYLKKDSKIIRDFFNAPDQLKELMNDPAFAEDAFYYEMGNHEYHINWQADWDVCSCFGNPEYSEEADGKDYLKELGYSDEVILAYYRARRRFLKDCDENDWY